ncbi:DUF86 domain-containing protein [Terasakiella sp. A23]|uniref:HepT-like ribonuclease domain-containing protein n=1 Tax=Terasakiella sp. FCG-A23 TaxID=3080561 RepID=UPI002953F988|nr:DUF86 domain-containing protein [Terasakiella sp. A23]MDV7340415.1 DUF86 domain-containing protein [Terasakiella sp. A23]
MTKPHKHHHLHNEERWHFHIIQMILAIEKIETYVQGMTRNGFLSDDRTIDAVIRNLEIIGEATHHIPNKVRKSHRAIPWATLRHMRNFLAHEYFAVDPKIIWETVSKDLSAIKQALKKVY